MNQYLDVQLAVPSYALELLELAALIHVKSIVFDCVHTTPFTYNDSSGLASLAIMSMETEVHLLCCA